LPQISEIIGCDPRMLIAGTLQGAGSAGVMPVESPGDGVIIGEVPAAGPDDVDRAVEAADAAFMQWRFTDMAIRRQRILDLAALIKGHGDELARIEAIDSGSPIQSMRRDIIGAVQYLEWVAGQAYNWGGTTPATAGSGIDLTLREPYGVTARIIAFNHPLYFACKLAPPLLTGNTVVVKLPDQTPLSGLWLASRISELFPPGVVNILSGRGAEAGVALVNHPKVARVAFTGSVATGRSIARAAAERLAPVHLELGGKNPMIVCADAEPHEAMKAALRGMNYSTQGQSCGSYSRLFLHDKIYDEAVEALVALTRQVRIGHPLDERAGTAAMIGKGARDRAEAFIREAVEDGAKVATGGQRPDHPDLRNGWYLEPTVLTGVSPDMRIAREEIFGPVQSVIRWSDPDAVIEAANSSEYGLTANVWSNDIDLAFYIARRVDSGSVAIKGDGTMHWFGAPFGGFKFSGCGKEDSLEEIVATTREKNLYLNLAGLNGRLS
jgi:betaine-aldehyde dehydrogenase